jgi:hypothetical protein
MEDFKVLADKEALKQWTNGRLHTVDRHAYNFEQSFQVMIDWLLLGWLGFI